MVLLLAVAVKVELSMLLMMRTRVLWRSVCSIRTLMVSRLLRIIVPRLRMILRRCRRLSLVVRLILLVGGIALSVNKSRRRNRWIMVLYRRLRSRLR